MDDKIRNSAADPDTGMRRSGGTDGDLSGGHDRIDNEWRGPSPDRADATAGAGSPAPATESGTLAYTDAQKPNLPAGERQDVHTSFEQPVEGAENRLRIDPQTKRVELIEPGQ